MANVLPTVATLTYNAEFYTGYEPTKAIDGNAGTAGSIRDTGGNPWWRFDLGESYIIASWSASQSLAEYPSAVDTILEKSDNGTDWTEVDSGLLASFDPRTLPENSAGRYWRISAPGHAGWWTTYEWVLDGEPGSPPSTSMEVTPDPLYVGGGPTQLTATLTAGTWDPDNQSDTTFSVDHGTIDAQHITSETTVQLYYTPADYLGTITFSETKYTLSDAVTATLIPPEEGGPGFCPFDAEFIELANSSEKRTIDDQLMTENSVVTGFDYPFNNLTVPEALGEIWVALFHTGMALPEGHVGTLTHLLWELINGSRDPAVSVWPDPSGVPLMQQLDEIRTDLNDLRTGAEWNLDDLALVLGGSPVKSHADILNAIGSAVGYSSVIDAISQLRGDSLSTVREVLLQLATIRTGGFYTLGDVLEAISGLGSGISVDLGPILTKLHEIQPNESYDLTTLTSLLVNLGNAVGAISNSLTSYRTPSMYTVQHILDAIAAARAAIVAAVERVRVPPIWPGAESVTLGASYDLSTTAVVTEPMDGVLVNITGTDPGTSFFQYQGMRAWRHIGGLTFFQEGGYCETHQALGFSSAIYVPKSMVRASGVRLFLGHGPQGTLRPWTIN